MANLFSGLESLGLGNLSEMKLFEHKEKEKAEAGRTAEHGNKIKETGPIRRMCPVFVVCSEMVFLFCRNVKKTLIVL